MSKQKTFICCFLILSFLRDMLGNFFPGCFLLRHVWIIYIVYFIVLGLSFDNLTTVPMINSTKKAEYIMLGDGTVTNEIFDPKKYNKFTRLHSSENGNAYSSTTGEMMYTKKVELTSGDGEDTDTSIALFWFFYTVIGLYIYYLFTDFNWSTDMFKPVERVIGNFSYMYRCVFGVVTELLSLIKSGFNIVFNIVF